MWNRKRTQKTTKSRKDSKTKEKYAKTSQKESSNKEKQKGPVNKGKSAESLQKGSSCDAISDSKPANTTAYSIKIDAKQAHEEAKSDPSTPFVTFKDEAKSDATLYTKNSEIVRLHDVGCKCGKCSKFVDDFKRKHSRDSVSLIGSTSSEEAEAHSKETDETIYSKEKDAVAITSKPCKLCTII